MTTVEAEWDQRAVDEMLAEATLADRTCAGCSSDLAKSLDSDLAAHGVDVDDDTICWVCRAREQHKDALQERHKNDPGFWRGRTLVASLAVTDKREAGD